MRQLALVALVAAAARASTVLRRDNRATFATTTLKFFGPCKRSKPHAFS